MKTLQIVLLVIIVIGVGLLMSQNYWVPRLVNFIIENENGRIENEENGPTGQLGGDRDEHGCIGSAGYSWCDVKNKCLRVWEEPCESGE